VGGQSSSGPFFLMSVNQDFSTTTISGLSSSKLIFLEFFVKGRSRPLRALVDTGASSNFIRAQAVHELSLLSLVKSLDSSLLVRMANGTIQKQIIKLTYCVNNYEGTDSFFLLDLDERFDVILGMAWLIRHQPVIDWTNQSIVSFNSSN
jgi:predicted aspartyl protease